MTRTKHPGEEASTESGGLARLLGTERRLARRLEETQAECDSLLADARRGALDLVKESEDAHRRRVQQLLDEEEAKRRSAAKEIEDSAQRECERYDAVPPEVFDQLVAYVVERVLFSIGRESL